jgi:hypothetical protein
MASRATPLTRTEGVPDKGGRPKRLLRRPLFLTHAMPALG